MEKRKIGESVIVHASTYFQKPRRGPSGGTVALLGGALFPFFPIDIGDVSSMKVADLESMYVSIPRTETARMSPQFKGEGGRMGWTSNVCY